MTCTVREERRFSIEGEIVSMIIDSDVIDIYYAKNIGKVYLSDKRRKDYYIDEETRYKSVCQKTVTKYFTSIKN